MKSKAIVAGGFAFLMAMAGCASQQASNEQKAEIQPGEPGQVIKDPALFREAKLPAGFPPAGPVGEVVIKQYPASRAAVVKSDNATEVSNSKKRKEMFKDLFNHIKANKIEMSAPVAMTYEPMDRSAKIGDATEWRPMTMAFFYGDPAAGKTGMDGDVDVVDLPAMKVVSIGVRGGYDAPHYKASYDKLNAWLEAHKDSYAPVGPPRYMGYNSPLVPSFWRFGEVQVQVTETGK